MPTTRTAHADWTGDLAAGRGIVSFDSSGIPQQEVTWKARAEQSDGLTSPEELIAAAHSSCYSMALSKILGDNGTAPESIRTQADVTFQPGTGITGVHLTVRARVPGSSAEDFATAAEKAKSGCPVSQALTGTTITLDAALE
ncbi:OsmC family protein [Salinactinospora qingdaonensis]|uniref:OsmC family protein n=1 Tax=Salinactinospora qingdaonensis TaxID=702744 RepID=A0ABP7GN58_9ACTN